MILGVGGPSCRARPTGPGPDTFALSKGWGDAHRDGALRARAPSDVRGRAGPRLRLGVVGAKLADRGLCNRPLRIPGFQVTAREKWLTERFPTYLAYQERVRRLIPFLY